jgi:hypothetical protein
VWEEYRSNRMSERSADTIDGAVKRKLLDEQSDLHLDQAYLSPTEGKETYNVIARDFGRLSFTRFNQVAVDLAVARKAATVPGVPPNARADR